MKILDDLIAVDTAYSNAVKAADDAREAWHQAMRRLQKAVDVADGEVVYFKTQDGKLYHFEMGDHQMFREITPSRTIYVGSAG